MWQVFRRQSKLAFAFLLTVGSAQSFAQSTYINQSAGFNLPGVQLPQGHDEVRAADGTTCRSAVSGTGAYMDVGFIGNPQRDDVDATYSAYTRVVIPLGRSAPRLDCSRLYNLEVQRLEMELKLMQMGLTRGIAPAGEATTVSSNGGSWEEDDWSTDGLQKK
jgi:hypothetical protein